MADKKQEDNKNKTLFNAAQISIDSIFQQMHEKAIEQSKKIAKVQNSIIDENGKFHGAGSHIIAATSYDKLKLKKTAALQAIQEYVKWFSGPDIVNTISEDKLIALTDDKVQQIESIDIKDIYKNVLNEEATSNNKKNADKNDNDNNKKSDNINNDESAKGYYIVYKLSIEGQKETPLSDAFKTFGKGLIKGLGIQSFDWKSAAKGKEYTVGDLLDNIEQVFGKIQPEELRSRFVKNAKAKYSQTVANDVQFYDQKTILQHLKRQLNAKDIQKIKTANYSLCYRVPANDKSKKLINTTVVADLITQSIKGIFKKFKNAIKKDDVILVNNYNETNKDQKKIDRKLEPVNAQSTTKTSKKTENKLKNDSLISDYLVSKLQYIFEDIDAFDNTILEARSEKQEQLILKILDLVKEKQVIDALANDKSYEDINVEQDTADGKHKAIETKEELIKILQNGKSGIGTLSVPFMEKLVIRLQNYRDIADATELDSTKSTDVDFYIVPMKNLKMDNTDDDDEKEVEGKSSK